MMPRERGVRAGEQSRHMRDAVSLSNSRFVVGLTLYSSLRFLKVHLKFLIWPTLKLVLSLLLWVFLFETTLFKKLNLFFIELNEHNK